MANVKLSEQLKIWNSKEFEYSSQRKKKSTMSQELQNFFKNVVSEVL